MRARSRWLPCRLVGSEVLPNGGGEVERDAVEVLAGADRVCAGRRTGDGSGGWGGWGRGSVGAGRAPDTGTVALLGLHLHEPRVYRQPVRRAKRVRTFAGAGALTATLADRLAAERAATQIGFHLGERIGLAIPLAGVAGLRLASLPRLPCLIPSLALRTLLLTLLDRTLLLPALGIGLA